MNKDNITKVANILSENVFAENFTNSELIYDVRQSGDNKPVGKGVILVELLDKAKGLLCIDIQKGAYRYSCTRESLMFFDNYRLINKDFSLMLYHVLDQLLSFYPNDESYLELTIRECQTTFTNKII